MDYIWEQAESIKKLVIWLDIFSVFFNAVISN